jgi:hypothetical protein
LLHKFYHCSTQTLGYSDARQPAQCVGVQTKQNKKKQKKNKNIKIICEQISTQSAQNVKILSSAARCHS